MANFAGGVLDGLTMGNGEAVLRALPGHGEENVRWGTTESRAGTIFGVVLSIPLAVPAAARGLALGPGRLVIPEVIHSAWGGVAFFDGLNDLRQTHEFCQANPGAPCRDRYGPQIVQTVGGGWAGVGSSSLGGIASLLGMLWDACQ